MKNFFVVLPQRETKITCILLLLSELNLKYENKTEQNKKKKRTQLSF